MGTYFALMDEAAERAEDYQSLDHIREVLLKVQKGEESPQEVFKVLGQLNQWEKRVEALKAPGAEQTRQAALDQLKALKSRLEACVSAAHR